MSALTEQNRDHLKPMTLENLAKIDRGKMGRMFDEVQSVVLNNINRYPVRDGKAEERCITVKVFYKAEIAMEKQPIEIGGGRVTEVDVPKIVGLKIRGKISSVVPDRETGDVYTAVDIRNGAIHEARFNPNNPENPAQLELFEEQDEDVPVKK